MAEMWLRVEVCRGRGGGDLGNLAEGGLDLQISALHALTARLGPEPHLRRFRVYGFRDPEPPAVFGGCRKPRAKVPKWLGLGFEGRTTLQTPFSYGRGTPVHFSETLDQGHAAGFTGFFSSIQRGSVVHLNNSTDCVPQGPMGYPLRGDSRNSFLALLWGVLWIIHPGSYE